MEFLSRSWSVSASEVSKALSPAQIPFSKNLNGCGGGLCINTGAGGGGGGAILEDIAGEMEENNATVSGNPFSFASSETSLMVMERIMSQSVSKLKRMDRIVGCLVFLKEIGWRFDCNSTFYRFVINFCSLCQFVCPTSTNKH